MEVEPNEDDAIFLEKAIGSEKDIALKKPCKIWMGFYLDSSSKSN